MDEVDIMDLVDYRGTSPIHQVHAVHSVHFSWPTFGPHAPQRSRIHECGLIEDGEYRHVEPFSMRVQAGGSLRLVSRGWEAPSTKLEYCCG